MLRFWPKNTRNVCDIYFFIDGNVFCTYRIGKICFCIIYLEFPLAIVSGKDMGTFGELYQNSCPKT